MECPYDCTHFIPCKKCQIEYEMPHNYCCLTECGQHEFCRSCTKGAYLKGDK